jgi:hypothetical protein
MRSPGAGWGPEPESLARGGELDLASLCGTKPRSGVFRVLASLIEPEQLEQPVPYRVVEQLDVTWLEGQDPDQFQSVTTPGELERLHVALSSQR